MTKNPNHIQYLLRLLNEFPKANVIITHRDPAKVVPSWSKILIYSHHQLIHNDAMDPDAVRLPSTLLKASLVYPSHTLSLSPWLYLVLAPSPSASPTYVLLLGI